jgi:glutamyl-tRNA synthetase
LQQLVDAGHVFACSCSRADLARDSRDGSYPGTCLEKNLPLDAPDMAWRVKTEEGRGKFQVPSSVRHFIVRKKDGDPAYQLTSLVDDIHFGVDLIVRGKDLFDSTMAQSFLATKLSGDAFRSTVTHHHDLMKDPNGRKMSKSAGSTSIQYLRQQGATPTEIFTQIASGYGKKGKAETWQELYDLLNA